MYDFKLRLEVEDEEGKDKFKDFKCHTTSLATAVDLAEKELGYKRVVNVLHRGDSKIKWIDE